MNTDEVRKHICIVYVTQNKIKCLIKLKRCLNSEKSVITRIKHYKAYQKDVVTPKGRYNSHLLV